MHPTCSKSVPTAFTRNESLRAHLLAAHRLGGAEVEPVADPVVEPVVNPVVEPVVFPMVEIVVSAP